MTGDPKCLKCEKAIQEFAVRHAIPGPKAEAAPAGIPPAGLPRDPATTVKPATGPGFHGAMVCCPHCMTVISVVAEPNAIAADVVRRLRLPPAQPARRPGPQGTDRVK
jgi:hypothetical protein